MKAMILAAGLGSRLGDITRDTPKCLLSAGGKTMLEHTIGSLGAAGVSEIVINLHYHGSKIKSFIEGGKFSDLAFHFTFEKALLGTGGGVKNAEKFLRNGGDFFVVNSDIYTDLPLKKLLSHHREQGHIATLAVMERDSDRLLLFNSEGMLAGWENRAKGSRKLLAGAHDGKMSSLAFSGIQVVSEAIFEYMPPASESYSIITSYLKASEENEGVGHFRMDESFWMDMGTPERYEELKRKLSH